MTRKSLAQAPARTHTLVRVYGDGAEEPVGEHHCFEQGWAAGQHAVHADRENAYSLYRGKRRVAKFCHQRLAAKVGAPDWSALPS